MKLGVVCPPVELRGDLLAVHDIGVGVGAST
jgi:hypothetical protein